MATTNALLGTARLNNFRLNYLPAAVATERRTKVGILLDGQDVRGRVRRGSVTIRDVINDAPNTASFAIGAAAHEPYREGVLADGPVAYWRLGDVTATAQDATGRGHTGTLSGAVAINQPGAIGDGDRAMRFPGTTGARIEVAAAADLALTQSVVVEAWVKTDRADQRGGIVEKTIGGAVNTSYALFQYDYFWYFRVFGPAGYVTTQIAVGSDVGQWVHLVGVFEPGASFALWRNGIREALVDASGATLQAGAGVLEIGHAGASGGTLLLPFAGLIDEVAIYPSLRDARIAAHYRNAFGASPPVLAQSLRITVGVDAPTLLFNGELSQLAVTYEGRPEQVVYHCNATDDTARANRRRPFGEWRNVSATTVAQELIARFVPGFGSAFVQPGLPPVTVIFDGSEGLNRCLTQITNLIGGYWYFSDHQLHLFLTEATDAPDPIDATPQRFLNDPPIAAAIEMSQVRTRVYGRGHGEALLSAVAPTETIVPIASTVMFAATGGQAQCGAQVLTYTGCAAGGDGSLVGPGAGPSVAATVTPQPGAGLGAGVYQYAYTDVTGSGESLPGPLATLTVGAVTPPPLAPGVSLGGAAGSGPDPGPHQYAVTFVTTSGETTPSPTTTTTTLVTPAPPAPPTVSPATPGPGVDVGTHDYVATFVTAVGETTPTPLSASVAARLVAPPTVPRSLGFNTFPLTSLWHIGDTVYFVDVFRTTAGGETTGVQSASFVATGEFGLAYSRAGMTYPSSPEAATKTYVNANGVWVGSVYPSGSSIGTSYGVSSTAPPSVNGAVLAQIPLSRLPVSPDASVTGRKLYRRFNAAGNFLLVATLANNTATVYTDTLPNASRGAAAPVSNTAWLQQRALTLPIGDVPVTGRRVYRTVAGGTVLQLAGTIADDLATFWVDTLPDAALGAAAPTVNTASANQVAVGGIAVGAAPVTARKLYRTIANGAQLKFLATIADNTTLTYLDALGDASLGANAPTSDSSGLTQPQGQVNAGSSTLPTASAGPFLASGWVLIGSQLIRYTGISGNSLTGIPAAGIGALVTTVRYGDHILSAPVLTGVTVPGGSGLIAPASTPVYLWVQRDDAAAQAAMAASDGGDGIYEYLAQDERRGLPSLTAICDAHLLAYKAPIATVSYASRDLKTRSGKPIAVDLESPPIRGTLVIQDVTIDEIDIAPGLAPRFTVTASTVRLSLDDLLRQLAGTLEI